MSDTLMSTYARLPVHFEKGEGVWLWDDKGNKYLDALSGIAVCSLGHANKAVAETISAQSRQLMHTSNLYGIAHQENMSAELCKHAGMEKAFICNSGAEANEAAIKIARLHGNNKGIATPTIIVMDGSFHGRTMATLTATGNPKVHAGFAPLVQGFVRAPYNDIEAIKQIAATNKEVVAVLVEPVQGEGGINIASDEYLQNIREICDANDWLMMLDEIQTGMCRTGKWFAYQHSGARPDVMTVAKALGNGFPVGACLAQGKAAEILQPGNHGTTYGGNPLACATALTVINEMDRLDLANHTQEAGDYFVSRLKSALVDCDNVVEIRGKGLMVGIELNAPCGGLVKEALDAGLLINVTADKVIRLLPPLIIGQDEIDQIVDKLASLIRK